MEIKKLEDGGDLMSMESRKQAQATISVKTSQKLSGFLQYVKLKYVKLGYHYVISYAIYMFLSPIIVIVVA